MALHGTSPERGELDSRVVWDEDDAIDALSEAIRIIVDGVTVDGTLMADERESLLWGFVNCLHSQVTRLDRTVDRITPEMKNLERAQDDTEVKAWELQTLTDRAQSLGDRIGPGGRFSPETLMHMTPVARVCHLMLRLGLGRGNG